MVRFDLCVSCLDDTSWVGRARCICMAFCAHKGRGIGYGWDGVRLHRLACSCTLLFGDYLDFGLSVK